MPRPRQRREAALFEPHVDYVLLAEFDIDEGSTLKHQYPAPTGTDEHLFAEHMLPDGAHDRSEDWTVFFLGQVPALVPDTNALAQARAALKGKAPAEEEPEDALAPEQDPSDGGLLHVLSLVRTKKDATVRRGALVKSLAIATRNPYIQIYKPLLLLALEDYFNNPSVSILAALYDSLNSIDVAGLPWLSRSERLILRTSDRKDLFDEKFPLAGAGTAVSRSASVANSHGRSPSGQSFAAYSAASSNADHSDPLRTAPSVESLASNARRGGPSLSASGSFAPTDSTGRDDHPGSHSPELSRVPTLNSLDGEPSSSASGPGSFGARYSRRPSAPQQGHLPRSPSLSFSQTSPTLASRDLGPDGKPKDTHFFETKVAYNGLSLPVKIPLSTFPAEIGDYSLIKLVQTFSSPTALVPGPLHPHLHTAGPSTPPIILLLNAIITGQRVVFLGHGQPAGRVAELVLAASALATGCGTVLQGVEERVFPYTNLSNLDNLQNVPGFVAGVCNPAFADRPSWWDVLCNVETGKVSVSKDLKPLPAPAAAQTISLRASRRNVSGSNRAADGADEMGAMGYGDAKAEATDVAFMQEILGAVQAHYGESVIRARFTDYVQRFVRIASRYEEETTSATTIGYPCAAYNSAAAGAGYGAQASLGAGVVFADEAAGWRELGANAARVERWMKTPSYRLYQQAFRATLQDSPFPGFDLTHQLSRLRLCRNLSPTETTLIFSTLAEYSQTDEQVVALLAQLPSHQGGLLPLSFGFFHPSAEVRHYTLELFDNLSAHPTGSKFVSSLNLYQRSAYLRLSTERDMIREQQQQQQYHDREDEREHERRREPRHRDTTVTLASFANANGAHGAGREGNPQTVQA